MDIREKLVELLHVSVCDYNCDECEYSISDEVCIRHLEEMAADYLIANGVIIQEWIPVSEPPKENGRYYIHVKMHDISYVKIASFSKESVAGLHDNGWHDYDSDVGFYEVKDITHWTHLPRPPKGEQTDET